MNCTFYSNYHEYVGYKIVWLNNTSIVSEEVLSDYNVAFVLFCETRTGSSVITI